MRLSQFISNGAAQLLATGQLTQYGSGVGLDDGFNQKGKSKIYTILTTGQYSGTVAVVVNSKTDTKSNAVVVDNRTKLMWSRTVSASVGASSNGLLEWTTTGSGGTAQGIFPYVAAANAVSLAGYTDWRIPNRFELLSICDHEASDASPDSTAFPSFPTATGCWSSTTQPSGTTVSFQVNFSSGASQSVARTTALYCLLVRGGA